MKKLIRKWLGIDRTAPEEVLQQMMDVRDEFKQMVPAEVIKEIRRAEERSIERSKESWERVQKINSHPLTASDLVVYIYDEMYGEKNREDWTVNKYYSSETYREFTISDFVREVFTLRYNDVVIEEVVRKINELQLKRA